MRTVEKLDVKAPIVYRRKRVAAYCRVSIESERMQHSLSAQISYYNDLIQKNPDWEFAGVFADYGASGTATKDRTEFNRMLDECAAGKIDIILTKSITRFARNTVDLLSTVRHLKDLGVEVRFEKENINSLSGDGELMLTVLASFAQEESRSISENCKWGIRKRFQSGDIGAANKHILGYRYDDTLKKYLVIPDEAKVVKWLFEMYIEGLPLREICDRLNAAGYRTVRNHLFQEGQMANIVKNEIYAGDIRRQKSYITDPITKNKVKNKGELPQYYYKDCHEAILDRETYERVLAERDRRTAALNPTYPFTKKIKCGYCGHFFTRKARGQYGKDYCYWICRCKKEVGVTCVSRNYKETDLERISARILGDEVFDAESFNAQVKEIIVLPGGSLEYHLIGKEIRVWKDLHLDDTLHVPTVTPAFKGKIRCGLCGGEYLLSRKTGRWVYWQCEGRKHENRACDAPIFPDYHLRQISTYMLGLDDFDEQTFLEQVELIRVLSKERLEYHFTDGRVDVWEKL